MTNKNCISIKDKNYNDTVRIIITHENHQSVLTEVVGDVHSSKRRISSVREQTKKYGTSTHHGRCELDSHTDTIVTGKNFTILNYTGRSFEVSPFSKQYKPLQDIPIVTTDTRYSATNVRCAFKHKDELTLEKSRGGKSLVGYQEIKCHMIFDVKMYGNLTRKARFVAGGHTTDPPSSITYSSVVARDSVRIAFTVDSINDLNIWVCDIGNAYLNAPCREKIWKKAGLEFGQEKGTVMVIDRSLYGLKTSGASWRSMLADTLSLYGYVQSKADMDVWLKP